MLALPLRGSTPELYHGKYVAGMFGSGEQGVWYDPSDLSTMYQDAAGTVPVTAVGQPVGLILDKSKNGVGKNGAKRVNLLTMTEQFNDSAWVKTGLTVSANVTETIDPNTDRTAEKIIETTPSTTHFISRNNSPVTSGAGYVFSCYAKAAERSLIFIGCYDTAKDFGVSFDLIGGSVSGNRIGTSTALVSSSEIVAVGNGWYKCSITFTATSSGTSNYWAQIGLLKKSGDWSGNDLHYVGEPTKGVYIWGADLRLASEANTQPIYQRIDANWASTIPGNHATQATTTSRPTLKQDASGKYYLSFDGVDDYLSTGSIDFTATDKMTVLVGVMAITPSFLIICELSNSVNSNNGSFYISCYTSGSYAAGSKGTILKDAVSAKIYPYPTTNTITLVGDISGDRSILRVNGSQVSKNTGDQGTGNYGNYPLYIGRRGGTTFPFAGNLYGLIVRGAATDDLHLTHAEKYLAYKSGVTL